MGAKTIRSFQSACYAWLALYMLALVLSGEAMWANAPVQLFRPDHGVLRYTTRWEVNLLAPAALVTICLVIMVISFLQIRRHRWWLGLVVWFLFRIITHRTWLASNGGVQLMENMLIWCALMGKGTHPFIGTTAFWIARLQLLLAYAAAAAHKFTGTTWLDGSAVMMVANDPGFSLGWLAGRPALCTTITYATLGFMTLFPFAVWWLPSRRVFLVIGVLFHLATAVFMGIPQMGLAFIACYAVWLGDDEAGLIDRVRAWFKVPPHPMPAPHSPV